MHPLLSVVITSLNENEETNNTVDSIRMTAGHDVEIIVVDDFSDTPVAVRDKRVVVHRNSKRIGVGPSRQLGATFATTDHLLIIDAHMRFEPGWLNEALHRIVGNPETVYCATCLGLEEGNMDITKFKGEYHGATLCLFNPDTKEILEGKWLPNTKPEEDNYEIPCLMGAAYFIPKAWFFRLRGLNALKMWGSDEPYFSLKTYMAGGSIKMLKKVRVGHMFRGRTPYATGVENIIYNKLRMIHTLIDPKLGNFLIGQMPASGDLDAAKDMINKEKLVIEEHRKYYHNLFVRDLYWYCDRFKIPVPDVP